MNYFCVYTQSGLAKNVGLNSRKSRPGPIRESNFVQISLFMAIMNQVDFKRLVSYIVLYHPRYH